MDTMPQLIREYRNLELVDTLLFKLPWICYAPKEVEERHTL